MDNVKYKCPIGYVFNNEKCNFFSIYFLHYLNIFNFIRYQTEMQTWSSINK